MADEWHELASFRGRTLRPPEVVAEVDSTNAELLRRIDRDRASRRPGVAHGDVLVARRQTSGHGSRGRAWHDVAERSLALTVALAWPSSLPPTLATWIGVLGVTDLLAELELPFRVKWPNDALVGERKVAGVLAETRTHPAPHAATNGSLWIALGIGLNVAHHATDFVGEFATPPTSLALEGRTLTVDAAAARLLAHVDRRVSAALGVPSRSAPHATTAIASDETADSIRVDFLDRLGLAGKNVVASTLGRDVKGVLRELALDGTLTVEVASDPTDRPLAGSRDRRRAIERIPGAHVAALRAL